MAEGLLPKSTGDKGNELLGNLLADFGGSIDLDGSFSWIDLGPTVQLDLGFRIDVLRGEDGEIQRLADLAHRHAFHEFKL